MTKDEWLALPDAARWAALYDLARAKLSALPSPAGGARERSSAPARNTNSARASDPRAPRFDVRIPRREGFQWASETELASLEWWATKKRERAEEGGRYADKDRKLVTELERFIEWRRVAPGARWSGTRGEQTVTALPPSREPEVHAWENA